MQALFLILTKILIYVHIILPSITNTSLYSQHVCSKCINKRKKMLLFNVSPECWPSYGVKILPDNSGEAEAGMPSKVKECSGE